MVAAGVGGGSQHYLRPSRLLEGRRPSFDPIVTLRRGMDRIFDDFFRGDGPRPAQSEWHGLTWRLDENDKEIVASAELRGVTEKDVEVGLAGDIPTIKGEKRSWHEEMAPAPTWSAASGHSRVP